MATKKTAYSETDSSDFDTITISSWAQASKHINALWKAHNAHCNATGDGKIGCTDPPDTCGSFWKKPAKKTSKKR